MTVRQVWRKTTALFWQYPVLWLPVLAADLLSFFLAKLQKYVTHVLIYHLLLGPASVFGARSGLIEPSSNAIVFKAAMLGGALEWSMHFAQIFLYTTAFLITAALVRKILRQQTEFFSSGARFMQSRWREILGLSVRILGIVAVFAISLGVLISFTISQTQKYMVHTPIGLIYIMSVAAFCCMAYFAAPVAMRRVCTKILNTESSQNGRIYAVLTVLVSSLLGYCLPYLEGSFATEPFFSSASAVTTRGAIVSLLVAFPYAVLFIALTLIVDDDTGIGEPATDLNGLDGEAHEASPS